MIEPEFASVLKDVSREISTLSPTLRSAWDGRPLAILTRTAPARATAAHIALIGHITQHELRHHTTTIELANGYLNRFLLIACRRLRLLPEGGDPDPLARHRPGPTCSQRPSHTPAPPANSASTQTPASSGIDAYHQLARPQPGIAGAITARAEAHTIRLALLYALTDGKQQIQPDAPRRRARAPRLRRPLRRLGARTARPATRSPSRSTPPCKHHQPA